MSAPSDLQDAPSKATGALVYWKQEALRLRRRTRELESELASEKGTRRRDTRVFYRAAEVFAEAIRPALRLAHGGSNNEFLEWWAGIGKYVERDETLRR